VKFEELDERLGIVRRFYEALRTGNARELIRLLHRQCRVHLTAGLPNGYGRTYEGPRAVLLQMWGPIMAAYEMHPDPAEILFETEGRIIVLGTYRGYGRATRRPVDAEFVHILRMTDDQISELRQVTDSQRWTDALQHARDD
jgi:ketosteroid isomerase-like protein